MICYHLVQMTSNWGLVQLGVDLEVECTKQSTNLGLKSAVSLIIDENCKNNQLTLGLKLLVLLFWAESLSWVYIRLF